MEETFIEIELPDAWSKEFLFKYVFIGHELQAVYCFYC